MRRAISGWMVAALLVAAGAATAVARQESQQPPPSSEDSVAEAARKAKAGRAKSKPRKVYTEDDLSGLKKGTISVVGEESAPAAAQAEDATALPLLSLEASPGPVSGERDEAYWRERAGKLRGEVADLDQQIEIVKDEIRKGGGAGFDPQSGLGQSVIYYTDRNTRLQRLEARRAELQKQMDALLDEARKAGVPPGWLR